LLKEFKTLKGYKPIDIPIFEKYLSSDVSTVYRMFALYCLKYTPEQLKYAYHKTDIMEKDSILEEETKVLYKTDIEILVEFGILDNNFNFIDSRKAFLISFSDFIDKD